MTYELWSPAMIRYELRARAEPVVREYVDALPYDAPVVPDEIQVDYGDIPSEDASVVLDTILSDMTAEDGSLIRIEGGYVKRSIEDMAVIEDNILRAYRLANRDWYMSLACFGVIVVLWIITHLFGESIGIRMMSVPLFGLPTTIYDLLLIDAGAILILFRMFR